MSNHVNTLFEQARALAVDERVELVELLLDSLPADAANEDAWSKEAHRRWDEHVASGAETVDAFATVELARQALKRPGA